MRQGSDDDDDDDAADDDDGLACAENRLFLVVDLSTNLGPSASKKTTLIATTSGIRMLVNLKLGVNVCLKAGITAFQRDEASSGMFGKNAQWLE